jgi:hypothetical protein
MVFKINKKGGDDVDYTFMATIFDFIDNSIIPIISIIRC